MTDQKTPTLAEDCDLLAPLAQGHRAGCSCLACQHRAALDRVIAAARTGETRREQAVIHMEAAAAAEAKLAEVTAERDDYRRAMGEEAAKASVAQGERDVAEERIRALEEVLDRIELRLRELPRCEPTFQGVVHDPVQIVREERARAASTPAPEPEVKNG